ncbi:MAG: hypothetical protein NWF10_03155 [Candidatus Bathyarchaeota archaeon]|nr:hypothetical protein [Candidatus Bathyarchaeota archaeon]
MKAYTPFNVSTTSYFHISFRKNQRSRGGGGGLNFNPNLEKGGRVAGDITTKYGCEIIP